MDDSTRRLIDQFKNIAESGKFGELLSTTRAHYNSFGNDIELMIHSTNDLLTIEKNEFKEAEEAMRMLCQLFVGLYKATSNVNSNLADAYLLSLIEDHPFRKHSCLAPQLMSLMEAGWNFKEVAMTGNQTLIWGQAKSLTLYTNEFLSLLLSYIVPCLQSVLGKNVNESVFEQPYANKLQQLISLTNGENGLFYLLVRIASSKVRNGIGHGNTWLDSEKAQVRYTTGRKKPVEESVPMLEFLAQMMMGIYLARAYLASVSAIAVLRDGTEKAKSMIPTYLHETYQNS